MGEARRKREQRKAEKMLEISKRSPEEQAQIAADQETSHVVKVVNVSLANQGGACILAEEAILGALEEINERAKRAEMQAFDPKIFHDVTVIEGLPCLTLTIIAMWVSREKLASLQRQQTLMGPQRGA